MHDQTISLPTSPETRQKLEAAGWYLFDMGLKRTEHWCFDGSDCDIILHDGEQTPILGEKHDFFKVLEFASLVGISPPGFRLIQAEAAEVARSLCLLRADACDRDGHQEHADSWRETAAALSSESPKEGAFSTAPAESCQHRYPHVVRINNHYDARCECGWSAQWPAPSEEVKS